MPRTFGEFRGKLKSAVVVANLVCILVAGFHNGICKRGSQPCVGFNGNGPAIAGVLFIVWAK